MFLNKQIPMKLNIDNIAHLIEEKVKESSTKIVQVT